MLILVIGGSGSGKSSFAEDLAGRLPPPRVYLATMAASDEESRARIKKHRENRAGKGFLTAELPRNVGRLETESATILLECLSNLTANEMFGTESGEPDLRKNATARIYKDLELLLGRSRHLIVVTNQIFSDGEDYDPATEAFIECLAELNRIMAKRADAVYEVVCGIPLCIKENESIKKYYSGTFDVFAHPDAADRMEKREY